MNGRVSRCLEFQPYENGAGVSTQTAARATVSVTCAIARKIQIINFRDDERPKDVYIVLAEITTLPQERIN
jgi:hypothetical protein